MYRLQGIIPAMVTPFKKDYSINDNLIPELFDFFVDGQVDCVLVCGSTGEYTLMTKEERKKVIELSVKASGGRVPVMAGTGYHGTMETIEMTRFAQEAGADCALVITPHYLKPSEAALIEHYQKVAESVDIPIVIYNWPGGTGVSVTVNMVKELSGVKNIIGIKNTASQEDTNTFINVTMDREFDVAAGWETLLLPTLACGGSGGVGVAFNAVPGLIKALFNAFKVEGDIQKAQELHNGLLPLINTILSEPSPGPVKAAMEIIGIPVGSPRMPIKPASENVKNQLKKQLKDLGVI